VLAIRPSGDEGVLHPSQPSDELGKSIRKGDKVIEVGKSYEAEELAKLCGQEEDERYGHHAFVGERATVIAQDEGNGIVKVVQIISQQPVCSSCGKAIDRIFTSRTVHLVYNHGKWVESQEDKYGISQCSECYEEFSDEELDELGVPNEIR